MFMFIRCYKIYHSCFET